MQPCYRTKDKVKDGGTEFQGDFFFHPSQGEDFEKIQ